MNKAASQSQPTVALVGLGRVGAIAPAVPGPQDRMVIRNHVEAILAAGGRIAALVDVSRQRRVDAMAKLAGRGDSGIEQAETLSQLQPGCADIITLATPPQDRLALLTEALALRPKAVVLEKPLAIDLEEGAKIVKTVAEAGVPLYVCFNRRTDPGMRNFAATIHFEQVRAALFRYGKGLTNYGSHAVDHILQWFGSVEAVQSAPCGAGDAESACISYRCLMQSGLSVEVLGVPNVSYDLFEIEIFLPDSVLAIRNNGVEKVRWEVREDLYYPGYSGLCESATQDPPMPIGGFVEMYRELFDSISGQKEPTSLCIGDEAYEVLRVLAAVVRSAKENGRLVSLTEPDISRAPNIGTAGKRAIAIEGVFNDE